MPNLSKRRRQVQDLEFLKTQIIISERKYCNFSDKKGKINKKSNLPEQWVEDLKEISFLYGGKVKFLKSVGNSSFEGHIDTLILAVDDSGFGVKDICITFSHELSHLIQRNIHDNAFKPRNLGELLRYERTAERLGYFISKTYFPHLMKKVNLTHRNFSTYLGRDHIEWLHRYHYDNTGICLDYPRAGVHYRTYRG